MRYLKYRMGACRCVLFVTLGIVLSDSDCRAEVIDAASLSLEDVRSAVSDATTGDRVNLPAGSATWSGSLIVSKCIILSGAGIDQTVIVGNITDPYNGMISFKPDDAARIEDGMFRVTGLTLDAKSKSNGIYVYNNSATPITKVRIDHNKIMNAGGASAGRAVYIRGSVYGVADNNIIKNYTHGMDCEGINNVQWDNLPIELGNEKNFYFEDNILSSVNPNVFHAGGHGGRYVARYNDYLNLSGGNIFPVFDMHGNQPTNISGMMVNEIYGNDIDLGTKGGRITDQRGGTLMAFYNRIKWGSDGANSLIREEYLDSNYPSGSTHVMHVRDTYYWNIRANGNLMPVPAVTSNQYEDTYDLTQNVDFWVHNTNYNGTTEKGVFVGDALPATCSVGDGAWITSQSTSDLSGMVGSNPSTPITGTFYKCEAQNVWVEFYTPHTYPHPLRHPGKPKNLR